MALIITHDFDFCGQVAIKTEIEAAGFTVLKEKQTTLSEERAKEFYRTWHPTAPSFPHAGLRTREVID